MREDCGSRLADHCGIPSGRIFVIEETSVDGGTFMGDALGKWAIKTLLLLLLSLIPVTFKTFPGWSGAFGNLKSFSLRSLMRHFCQWCTVI